jgi:predicted RNase H-like HicB family nuclease
MKSGMKILVIIEKGEKSYGAYSPDVPGCFAVAETREEIEQLMKDALVSHIEFLIEKKLPLPRALVASYTRYVWYQRWHALLAFIRAYFAHLFSGENLFQKDFVKYVDISCSVS